MESGKKKLTLSINSEVIEKAKGLGINLSELTENALKLYSHGHDEDKIVTPDKLRDVYTDILKKISKILSKWNISGLNIGSNSDENASYLYILSEWKVYLWADFQPEEPWKTWQLDDEDLPATNFYDPEKIISNLVGVLYEKAKKNKEILDKLKILKNILELSNLTK